MRALVKDSRTPVFTHSGLQRKNILVEEMTGAQNEKEFSVSLVDWESAGWYPVYWEYFAAFLSFTWKDDWCSKVAEVVDA
jgi:thiamine kinase-like enzyme